MVKSLILAVALAVTVAPEPEPAAPAPAVAEAGAWRLSDARGRVSCTLQLTRETGIGGFAVKAPLACRRAFPPLKDLSAWQVDTQGGIVLVDAAKAPIVTFPRQNGGPYEAKAPDGKTWRLEPANPTAALTPRERMTGLFRLTGPGGGTLCEFNLTSNLFGAAGTVAPSVCLSPWSEKPFAYWSLQGGKLSLLDRRRQPILVLRSEAPGSFITNDPRDEAMMLVRR